MRAIMCIIEPMDDVCCRQAHTLAYFKNIPSCGGILCMHTQVLLLHLLLPLQDLVLIHVLTSTATIRVLVQMAIAYACPATVAPPVRLYQVIIVGAHFTRFIHSFAIACSYRCMTARFGLQTVCKRTYMDITRCHDIFI